MKYNHSSFAPSRLRVSFSSRDFRASRAAGRRRGIVLIMVLVVISLLSLSAYTFAELMFTEREAAWIHGRGSQARALSESGVAVIEQTLRLTEAELEEAGGIYHNPTRFQGALVVDGGAPRERGRFTVLAGKITQGKFDGVRHGLADESARLNLGILQAAEAALPDAGSDILLKLPGMTPDVADAILDWIDSDSTPRMYGAEMDYYSGMQPAYAPKNGTPDTIEELLLVRGVSPEMLFGADTNRNGVVDQDEQAGETIGGVDNSDGALDLGWAAYLTLYSAESNLRPDGTPRIDVNGEDLEQLHKDLLTVLPADWATYVCAYRQAGPTTVTGTTITQQIAGRSLDLTQPGGTRLTTILDLIGQPVQVTFKGDPQPSVVESPFANGPLVMASYMTVLADNLSVNPEPTIPARININQAPRQILEGIPGLEAAVVDRILSERDEEPDPDKPERQHETWLLAEGLVTLEEMKALMPFVTGGGNVFRAQIVGYFEEAGPSSRVEVVFDATTAAPRLVFWRDLSHLGRGFPVETLGLGQ